MEREEQVVLVNEQDEVLGFMGKQEAHEKGVLHRAISVILYNSKGEQLVQQRAHTKYHWAGIWSNTCCSHPRKNESYKEAAERRLYEELGIKTELTEALSFVYKAFDAPSGLTEHELDHVFTGVYDGSFEFNTNEVAAVRWMTNEQLMEEMKTAPDKFSFWFKIILDKLNNNATDEPVE